MTDTSTIEHQSSDMEQDRSHSSGSNRLSPSVLGLSVVSGLNLLCLAFIAYHFVGHPDDMAVPALEPPLEDAIMVVAPPPPATSDGNGMREASGNVEFAPISASVLGIASGVDLTDVASADPLDGSAATPSPPMLSSRSTPAKDGPSSEHWVQLGALSNDATARRFWSGLQQRHASLLLGQEPRYFGPSEVGGELHHIRLGPMDGKDATELCEDLAADGADCFRVGPMKGRS